MHSVIVSSLFLMVTYFGPVLNEIMEHSKVKFALFPEQTEILKAFDRTWRIWPTWPPTSCFCMLLSLLEHLAVLFRNIFVSVI